MSLAGIHHVSALSARIRDSRDFYVRVLGLRPLITTVNQDEPSMYHLFFGDGAGTPGSEMTVFDMPRAAAHRAGNNSVTLTTFRVAGAEALEWWQGRLDEAGVRHSGTLERDARLAIDFEDAVGTRLSLMDDGGQGESFPWAESGVPREYQVRGLGYTTLTVPRLEPTHRFLRAALGLTPSRTYAVAGAPQFSTHVYDVGAGGPHAEVHVVVRDDLPAARYGSGGVHHVALRVPALDGLGEWVERVGEAGYRNSGIVDRHYFRSLYVREPNGVLFELATDGPGFGVDEPLSGDRLSLPPFLEPRRAEIEAALAPLA